MKLIKAYIREFMAAKVIHALEDIGAPRLTVIDVKALGDEIAPEKLDISAEIESTYTAMLKLELVCSDRSVDEAVKVIKKNARTNKKGDGIIVISPIEEAISIRTGAVLSKKFHGACDGKERKR